MESPTEDKDNTQPVAVVLDENKSSPTKDDDADEVLSYVSEEEEEEWLHLTEEFSVGRHSQNGEVASFSGDDDNSTSYQSQTGTQTTDELDDGMYRQEKKKLGSAKIFVLCFLASLAIVCSWGWYRVSENTEEFEYKREFEQYGQKIIDVFLDRLEFKVTTATALATSLAASTDSNSWPMVSFSNWERRTAGPRRLAQATSIWFSPLVIPEDRSAWEAYAEEHPFYLQNNFTDPYSPTVARKMATSDSDSSVPTSPYYTVNWPVPFGMYQLQNHGDAMEQPEQEQGEYYAPIWQSAPSSITSSLAMFNQPSEQLRKAVLSTMLDWKSPLFSASQWNDTQEDSLVDGYNEDSGPHVFLYTPIFEQALVDEQTKVAGSLTMDLEWASFWSGSVKRCKGPLTIILSSSCGPSYTFEMDSNSEVTFVGTGAQSYANKLDLSIESTFVDFADVLGYKEDEIAGICSYSIRISPTYTFEQEFLTNRPTYVAMGIGSIFLMVATVFMLYDCVIERRQAQVMQSAKRSNAIIKSLFPAGIRNRLLDQSKAGGKLEAMLPDNYLPFETPKSRLKSYLTDAPMSNPNKPTTAASFVGSEPIADFFPQTTVLFADLAGFTAWSSSREPSQVFTLLETLYGAMDKAARRLGVFKVETVGDCYVAATGIPDPREDHAILMVRFASTCLERINELTAVLESALGPGTGDLAMRFGIHSGPVTAGVLRGEKSRFQLFGDTMNTASRIESTGQANRVHCSKETAELLIAGGKISWVEPRSEVVTAKGKGELVTYWLKPGLGRGSKSLGGSRHSTLGGSRHSASHGSRHSTTKQASTSSLFSLNEDSGGSTAPSPENTAEVQSKARGNRKNKVAWGGNFDYHNRVDRLVDYNVEVLISLLKKIEARRSVVNLDKMKEAETIGGKIALDELREVIPMPDYNPEAAIKMASDSTVEISPEVRSELRAYICRIANSYHDNPFHNFEHASHVALSANKLLKRIVMPDEVDYRKHTKQKKVEKVLAIAKDLHEHTLGISSDPMTQFAVVFSALIHDAGHTGVPNFILAKEEPDVAEHFKNKSIAEQRSIDIAWDILMEDGYENLRRCMFPTTNELKHFRRLIVSSVMATDIFDKELSALRKARWQKCFHPEELLVVEEECKADSFNRKATIVIEHIIQASDVAHTMQHWHVYQKWNERLFHEMYSAYKEGRSEKDPSDGWYNGEIWFFDNYVIPLAKKLKECGVFGVSSAEYLNYAMENRDEWGRKGQEVCEKMKTDFEAQYSE